MILNKPIISPLAVSITGFLLAGAAGAESFYSLGPVIIDGGGAAVECADYSASGSLAQPGECGILVSASYEIRSGFWAMPRIEELAEGEPEGEGMPEGAEGEGEGGAEGMPEGEGLQEGNGDGEGVPEGLPEGNIEEGFQEGELPAHAADQNGDGVISLTELLRVIQFFNSQGYYCVTAPVTSEDGYLPGPGTSHDCMPHSSDYNPQNWQISLTELLRLIQFFNTGGYHACPGQGTEDGYCPGPA